MKKSYDIPWGPRPHGAIRSPQAPGPQGSMPAAHVGRGPAAIQSLLEPFANAFDIEQVTAKLISRNITMLYFHRQPIGARIAPSKVGGNFSEFEPPYVSSLGIPLV